MTLKQKTEMDITYDHYHFHNVVVCFCHDKNIVNLTTEPVQQIAFLGGKGG